MLAPRLKPDTRDVVLRFIKDKFNETGAKGVVLGFSGGLDSAVVMKLCAEALGAGLVTPFLLPYGEEGAVHMEDARGYTEALGIEPVVVDIKPIVDAFVSSLGGSSTASLGNLKARARMTVLYHYANENGLLVMGTSNKSETAVGYFTKYGDGGADLAPIGDLYKTEVRELAREIGVPEGLIEKPPTAGLWGGQTDEGELGISYGELDRILLGIELGLADEEIVERAATTVEEVARIRAKVLASVHKRKRPLCPKVGIRTFGLDWRE